MSEIEIWKRTNPLVAINPELLEEPDYPDGTEVPLKGPDGQQIGTATVSSDEHGVTWIGHFTDPQWASRMSGDVADALSAASFGFSDQKLPVDAEPFGFRVFYRTGRGWRVSLERGRHGWDVIGGGWDGGEPRDVAAAELERFIAEAREALDALRAGREYGT